MCSFGGIHEDSKTNIDVGFPVCNSFKPILHYDQVCYELDLNKKFKKGDNLLMDLREGIVLTLDYNEDRQIGMHGENKEKIARIYFNTISKHCNIKQHF